MTVYTAQYKLWNHSSVKSTLSITPVSIKKCALSVDKGENQNQNEQYDDGTVQPCQSPHS